MMSDRKDSKGDQKSPEATDEEIDQARPGYYYDDSTGYEAYDPADEDNEEPENQGR